ncbi:AlbA family DNA-binding domain-containing protein [Flagellimonas flava]|uniref:AlbA family DNA-binding domain-containing protein n=1 Tax=Flagellimonas TaxID=444459 RepID=UPI003D65F690
MQRRKIGIWFLAGFAFGVFILQPLGLSLFLFDRLGDSGHWPSYFGEAFKTVWGLTDFDQILKNLLFGIMGSSLALMFFFRKRLFRLDSKRMEGHTVHELINKGESSQMEFKSSLRWNVRQGKVNKQLEFIIAENIAGFMNTEGGRLLIGVHDNGNILGLNRDFETLKKPDRDGFEQYLMQLISQKLGTHLCTHLKVSFCKYGENDVCQIEINPAKMPVYVNQAGRSRFYIRIGNATRELDLPQALAYIDKEKAQYN